MNYTKYARLRDERGYTDAAVARMAGIAKSSISDWKAGRTKALSLEKAEGIAKALEVTLDELVKED